MLLEEQFVTLQGHTSNVWSVAFNHDGSKIVSGSADKTVKVWDAVTDRGVLQTLEGHTSCVFSVAFNHDGSKIVSGSRDKTFKVWSASAHPGATGAKGGGGAP